MDQVGSDDPSLETRRKCPGNRRWGCHQAADFSHHRPTIGTTVERFSALFQHALSTRAGSDCIAHGLQVLSELNPFAQ